MKIILHLSLCLLSLPLWAQSSFLYNDGNTLHIQDQAIVHVGGDFTNQNGLVENEGLIEIEGDWTNNAAYRSDVSGVFAFAGDDSTYMRGSMAGLDDFHTLRITKTSNTLEDQVVIAENEVEVDESLELFNGRIATDTNAVWVKSSAANAIIGHNDPGVGGITHSNQRYIEGILTRDIQTGVEYDFPVGDVPDSLGGTGYQLAKLDIQSTGGASNIRMQYHPLAIPAINANPPSSDCNTDICGVFSGAWTAEVDAGKPTYNPTLYPSNYTEIGCLNPSPNRYFIARGNSITSTFLPYGTACLYETSMSSGQYIHDQNYSFVGALGVIYGRFDCGTDPYEPNNNANEAKQLPKVGIYQKARICESGDEDWFYFTVGDRNHLSINLKRLVADLQLDLYDASMNLISSSTNPNWDEENIILNNATIGAKYYVRVYGNSGAYSDEGYHLTLTTWSIPFAGIREEAEATRDEIEDPPQVDDTDTTAQETLIEELVVEETPANEITPLNEEELANIDLSQANPHIKIFPNPTEDVVTFIADKKVKGLLLYQFFNVQGQSVLRGGVEFQGKRAIHSVDLFSLAAGVYQVKMTLNGKDAGTQKLVIK